MIDTFNGRFVKNIKNMTSLETSHYQLALIIIERLNILHNSMTYGSDRNSPLEWVFTLENNFYGLWNYVYEQKFPQRNLSSDKLMLLSEIVFSTKNRKVEILKSRYDTPEGTMKYLIEGFG